MKQAIQRLAAIIFARHRGTRPRKTRAVNNNLNRRPGLRLCLGLLKVMNWEIAAAKMMVMRVGVATDGLTLPSRSAKK
jgi:hypothetical protein